MKEEKYYYVPYHYEVRGLKKTRGTNLADARRKLEAELSETGYVEPDEMLHREYGVD